MDIIKKSINDVLFRIPKKILGLAFGTSTYTTMSTKIMDKVVRPRVMLDLNLLSSNTIFIPTSKFDVIASDSYGELWELQDGVIGEASIIAPLSISTKQDLGPTWLNDDDLSYIDTHTRLSMVSDNLVFVYGMNSLLSEAHMECSITYNDTMNQLPAGANKEISSFITLAVKAFVHNELIIEINEGYIHNGAELNIVKDYIDKYESSEEEYEDAKRHIIGKLLFMSNETAMEDYVSIMFPRL
jgi:hypothetical protein